MHATFSTCLSLASDAPALAKLLRNRTGTAPASVPAVAVLGRGVAGDEDPPQAANTSVTPTAASDGTSLREYTPAPRAAASPAPSASDALKSPAALFTARRIAAQSVASDPHVDSAAMSELSWTVDVATLALEDWPLQPEQILEGVPETSGIVLDSSADGRVERGVWQHTPGVSTDVEADELFVVVSGRATVTIEGGPTLELVPGTAAVLHAGDRTVWAVHETLRKVYQTTSGANATGD